MTEAGEAVGRFLRARVAERWMPGATWWVEGPRGVVARGCAGDATRLPEPLPTTEGTPYDLASLTKPLATGLLLALFEQEGLLDPRSPAVALVPELARSAFARARLADLAAHAAGLPAWRPLALQGRSIRDYLATIAALPRAVEPGATLYSDLGYVILGVALERASGKPLDRLFEERVASPLALERLGFATPPRAFADAAATEDGNIYERGLAGDAGRSHAWRRSIPRGEVHDANAHGLGGVAGHAGLFGTAEAVARLAGELIAPRDLPLGDRARSRLLEPASGGATRTAGFVLACGSSAARGLLPDPAPGHTGFTGTSVWLDPQAGAVCVLLTNRVHPVVPHRDFQRLRRGFHRLARRAVTG